MLIPIIYQDSEILVCIKPVGVQSESSDNPQNSTLLALPNLIAEQEKLKTPLFTVHRLDAPVSGVMIYAKNKTAAANLSTQMQNGKWQKTYLAVVSDKPKEISGEMVDFLYHDKRKGRVFPVKKERKGVKKAILHYEVLNTVENSIDENRLHEQNNLIECTKKISNVDISNQNSALNMQIFSILQIKLETGRTHQIRAQCAARKLPLCGDGKYGSRIKNCNIALLSHKAQFNHPKTGEPLEFTCEKPSEFPWNLFK